MKYIPLAARICLALVFAKAGISHAMGFSGFADLVAKTLPLPALVAAFTIFFQLLGALSLIVGYKVKIGAALLIVFLIPATLLYHNFLTDPSQVNAFLKNVGLIGGLLMVIYTGAGAASIDEATA